MGFWMDIFSNASQTAFELLSDYSDKKNDEAIRAENIKREQENEKIRLEIIRYLETDVPIPERLKKEYPKVVVETCRKMGKSRLIDDVIPTYNKIKEEEAKYLKKIQKYEGASNALEVLDFMYYTGMTVLIIVVFVASCSE